MRRDIIVLLGVLFLAFIAIPFVPHESFMVLDNVFMRVILLAILVYSINYGPLVGVATFMLIAALLLERNYRVVSLSRLLFRLTPRTTRPLDEVEKSMDMPESTELQYVEDETGVSGESEFGPKDYSGQNDFEPLDLPENHKDVRPSVPLGEAAGAVFA
jgi:hypothetical protein